MKRGLGLFVFCLVIFFCFNTTVFADDTGAAAKTISLTINWLDDVPSDRPESITIELYRSVEGEVVPMDSKLVTAADKISENTWKVDFTYYYGNVWEYAFKVLDSNPKTALYNYSLIESGNGTDSYTFDYLYGHGDTQMTIEVQWDPNQKEPPPDSLTVNIYALEGGDEPERSIIMSPGNVEDVWTATVSGLERNASDYYIVPELPENYSYKVYRGTSPNIYIVEAKLNDQTTVTTTQEDSLSQGITDAISTIDLDNVQRLYGVLGNFWLNLLLFGCILIINFLAIYKHRSLVSGTHVKDKEHD